MVPLLRALTFASQAAPVGSSPWGAGDGVGALRMAGGQAGQQCTAGNLGLAPGAVTSWGWGGAALARSLGVRLTR